MISAPALATRFRVDEATARELAETFGTPLYVLDENTFRSRIRAYRAAFKAAYPNCEVAYASKANSTLALLAIANAEGCRVDVASEGEFRAALRAGVPAGDCHFHGNNKARHELAVALDAGIGQIVVDHFGELEAIAELLPAPAETELVLRLAPGVSPLTHRHISTGQSDTKFGFNIEDGSAERAVARCQELGLPLIGFHCHVGSQLLDPEAHCAGGEAVARFAIEMQTRRGFSATYLNIGGGLGARYTEADRPMDVESYCRLVVASITSVLAGSGLSPKLAQEPGRALVAEAGVTLYRVGVVKTVPARTYVCVDGGLADNPRPALYGARYELERMGGTASTEMKTVTVSGRHCESDLLFEDVRLPADIEAGDLLQVFTTGAYNASMASNYNRYPRPAAVLMRSDGRRHLIQRRESFAEMIGRESLPEDLT